jgi:tripartite-type tricarboxylate transporter receptor subunit TctC
MVMQMRRRTWVFGLTGMAAGLAKPLHAQAAWPNKPIRIILPFPAGSGTDSSARFIGDALSRKTGQPVIIENKPGANGLIAAQAAATSAPDGYTIFVTTMSTQSVNPHIVKKMPYDPVKDFAPVAQLSLSPMLLVVRNTDDQPKTYAELTERARKSSKPLAYGSGNTSSRVAAEVWRAKEKLQVTYVPYKGNPQALTDLIGGQIDLMFPDLTPSAPLVKSGKLRALAVTSAKRLPSLPDVPTIVEVGLPEATLNTWSAAYMPAGTPQAIVDKVSTIFQEALHTKEAVEHYARSGAQPTPSTPAELAAFTRSEYEVWGKAIKIAGIEPE